MIKHCSGEREAMIKTLLHMTTKPVCDMDPLQTLSYREKRLGIKAQETTGGLISFISHYQSHHGKKKSKSQKIPGKAEKTVCRIPQT